MPPIFQLLWFEAVVTSSDDYDIALLLAVIILSFLTRLGESEYGSICMHRNKLFLEIGHTFDYRARRKTRPGRKHHRTKAQFSNLAPLASIC
jgi:hypothetical protein